MIFSVWNVRNAEPGKGAICEPFTGEGDGMKCSIVYNWKEGEIILPQSKYLVKNFGFRNRSENWKNFPNR
jgi:hypothetical protein